MTRSSHDPNQGLGGLQVNNSFLEMTAIDWEEEFSATMCLELPQYSAPTNDGTTSCNTLHINLDGCVVT